MNLTQSEIGAMLGVDRRNVHMWIKRRVRNNFPLAATFERRDGRVVPTYDQDQVKAWHDAYDPDDWPNRPRSNRRLFDSIIEHKES